MIRKIKSVPKTMPRESEDLYRSIVENQTEFVIRLCPDSTLSFANRAYCGYLGKEYNELVGRNFIHMLPEGDRERMQNLLSSLTMERPVDTIEVRFIKPGKTLWHRWTSRAIFDDGGGLIAFQAAGSDVTDRKQLEQAFFEDASLYRVLFETAPAGLGIADINGNLIAFNNEMLAPGGYDREDIAKMKNVSAFYYDLKDREKVLDIIRKQGFLHQYPVQFKRKDGTSYDTLLSLRPVTYAGKACLQAMVEDITERKKIKKALLHREQLFRKLVETMTEGLGIQDEKGVITYVNERACRMLGDSRDELVGKYIYDFLDEANRNIIKEQIARRKTGETRPYELQWTRKDNKKIYTIISPQPIFNESGEYKGTFAILTDITERKKDEELILAYQQQLSLLSSKLSLVEEKERRRIAANLHDNVGQILACAMIKLGELIESSHADFRDAVTGIRGLIEQCITYTRSLTFELSVPILFELGLEAAVEWIGQEYQKLHSIQVHVRDDGKSKPLDNDMRIIMFKAVRELLTNVVKHAHAHNVTVSMERKDHLFQITVEDDGSGFYVEDIYGVTVMKYRFGLFSIREALKNSGGSISITSAPGSATSITLTAPLAEDKNILTGS